MSDLISKNQSLIEWKEDFKDFVEGLDIPRDDYKGIMEYIDEVPSASTELSNNSPKLDNENGDLISREAAIDAVVELCKHYTSTKSVMHPHIDFVIEELNNLPSAQPERKTGKWIRTRTMTHDGELYCSECEQEHPEQKIIWNFCPNCGSYNGGGNRNELKE